MLAMTNTLDLADEILTGSPELHAFVARDRWASLCRRCNLSIAAHKDSRPQIPMMVTTPLGPAPDWINELIETPTGTLHRTTHHPNQEPPAWPSLESPFSS